MKSYKHLFPQVCAVDNVLAAARTAMQGKLSGSSAARFHTRWETQAVQLAEELVTGTWRPGPYTPDFDEPLEDFEDLPQHHGDPFDRLIIAQAQVEGLTIVTRDENFPAYGVPLLW